MHHITDYTMSLLTNDDTLFCGHDHSNTTPARCLHTTPARCLHTTFDPEDNNMGDEAFINPFDDWTDDMDYVDTVGPVH